MQIQRTVETSASPAAVFAYLSDFTNTEEWDPGTISTTRVEGDGGVGTVYENVSEFNGKRSELRYTVLEHRPPSKVVLRGENRTLTALDTMQIEPQGTGTRVTYTADFTFKGVLRLVQPVLGVALASSFKKLGDEAEQGMRTALERL
jgi:carbon monoxide dehydrogenase subunit G